MVRILEVHQDAGADRLEQQGPATERAQFHIGFMTHGKCVYWINGQKVILEKGDFIIIPSGSAYYFKNIPTVFHSKYAVAFDDLSQPPQCIGLPILARGGDFAKVKLGSYDLVHDRLKTISKHWEEKLSYYETMVAALLLEVLVIVNREADRGSLPPEKMKVVEVMRTYIQTHYRGKITKETLGEAIRKSPNYTATLFRQVTGQTISDYVHEIRIRTAIYMLIESLLTIGEIAEYLGYNDISYFHKVFKRITGHVPSNYLSERTRR